MKSNSTQKKAAPKSLFTVELKFEPMEGLGGGFRQNWVSGKGNGIEFDLDSGAGLGNPLLTLSIKKGGKTHHFTADIRPMLTDAVNKARAAI